MCKTFAITQQMRSNARLFFDMIDDHRRQAKAAKAAVAGPAAPPAVVGPAAIAVKAAVVGPAAPPAVAAKAAVASNPIDALASAQNAFRFEESPSAVAVEPAVAAKPAVGVEPAGAVNEPTGTVERHMKVGWKWSHS